MSVPSRPVPGTPRRYAFPTAYRENLHNGLTVHVVPLRRLPVVTALLMSDAGPECEVVSDAGVASLTVDLLAEGTRWRDAAALAEAFEQLGGSLDTGVTWTHSEVSTTVLAAHLPTALQLLAEAVLEPAFAEGEVQRLRAERLAELLQQRTEPRGLADDMSARVAFAAGSRYALPDGGTEATVASISRAMIARHQAEFVTPRRSALIIAGDVDPDSVMQLAGTAFGGWEGAVSVAPDLHIESATGGRAVHLVCKPDSPQSELRIGHATVPRSHPDYYALTVMNAVLGGLFNSRINLNLRETHGYTYGAFSHFDWRRRASTFEVSTAVERDVTAAAIRETLGEIDRVRTAPIRAEELSLAIDYLTGVFPIRFETTAAIADALATREGYGLPTDYFDQYRERISAVTTEDVLRVAHAHLDPDRMHVVAVGDPSVVLAELESLSHGALRQYDASGRQIA